MATKKQRKYTTMEAKTKKVVVDCPVCINGWNGYGGDYDSLCDKHYLEIEPNEANKEK